MLWEPRDERFPWQRATDDVGLAVEKERRVRVWREKISEISRTVRVGASLGRREVITL